MSSIISHDDALTIQKIMKLFRVATRELTSAKQPKTILDLLPENLSFVFPEAL
jgi:hypothetical protein